MKYIIFQNLNGKKIPILFPEDESYQQVADTFKRATTLTISSAGKVSINDSDLFCHSAANDIGYKPTPDDEQTIIRAMKETDLR